jgi:glycine cleavage system protein P-like pyridoxal-binding family
MHRLKKYYELAFDETICMHECVFSASQQAKRGVHALDIAKFLIDQGMHPPTVYFPLTVKEALMIEPTETESKEAMDKFIEAMIQASTLSRTQPGIFKDSPKTTPIHRPDEVKAARELDTNYFTKNSPRKDTSHKSQVTKPKSTSLFKHVSCVRCLVSYTNDPERYYPPDPAGKHFI